MAELRSTGIHFGQPTYNQNGSETNNNTYQGRAPAIIKIGFGSASTVNEYATGGSGTTGYMSGTEVSMGVPKASDNIYRISWTSVADDNDGSTSGVGVMVYRYTATSGWVRLLAQGEHTTYDSNMSDWYRHHSGIFYIPVHPSYPTEAHSFRLYWQKHGSGQVRFNCDVGGDQRRGGCQNNTYEVWEINRDIFTTFGNFSPNF
tara:strand:- start:1753 stop:2361 length:609 start_codon:yes stop_codon:yes gene_type:complete